MTKPNITSKKLPLSAKPVFNADLIVTTKVYSNTLGDYYAALKLIRNIRSRWPNTRIAWLIKSSDKNLKPDLPAYKDAGVLNIYQDVLTKWDEAALSQKNKQVIKGAKLHIDFPADKEEAPGFNNVKTVRLFEYNCTTSTKASLLFQAPIVFDRLFDTGLGKGSKGIFIEKNKTVPGDVSLSKLSLQLREILCSGESVKDYLLKAALFFGYCANEKGTSRNAVNSISFIQNIIKLNNDKNQIDVVTPFTPSERMSLAADLKSKGFGCVEFVWRDDGSFQKEIYNYSQTGKKMRVLNFFRLTNQDMNCLMQAADPRLVMCTGDQSFSEVLSCGKVPFYQIRNWKRNFFNAFYQLCKDSYGESSVLAQYVDSLSPSIMKDSNVDLSLYLKNADLHKYVGKLSSHIYDKFNLYTSISDELSCLLVSNVEAASDASTHNSKQNF